MFGQNNTGPVPSAKLIENNPGIDILIPLWWSFFWRRWLLFVLVAVVCLVTGFALGFLFGLMGMDKNLSAAIAVILGVMMGLVGGVWAFMKAFALVLRKQFSGHRLALLPPGGGEAGKKMIENDPDVWVLFSLWWAFIWRQGLWLLLVSIILAITFFVLGMILHLMGADVELIKIICRILNWIALIPMSIWTFIKALRPMLGMQFAGHTLIILTPAAADAG